MPRESIRPEHHGTPAEHLSPLPTVEVGWQRELGSVQIGLETPVRMVGGDDSSGQHHLVDHLYASSAEAIGDALLEQLAAAGWKLEHDTRAQQGQPASSETLGRMVLDAVTGGAEGFTGWYTHLDREGSNRLIRLVRKARDAAFGRDE